MDAFNHWLEVMLAAIGTFIASTVGLAMKYAHRTQRGEVVDLTKAWLDIPMIIFAAWCGSAIHEYFNVPEMLSYVASCLITYMGDRSISIAVDLFKKKMGVTEDDDDAKDGK